MSERIDYAYDRHRGRVTHVLLTNTGKFDAIWRGAMRADIRPRGFTRRAVFVGDTLFLVEVDLGLMEHLGLMGRYGATGRSLYAEVRHVYEEPPKFVYSLSVQRRDDRSSGSIEWVEDERERLARLVKHAACTGPHDSRCPVCGDCSCPSDKSLGYLDAYENCPLHGRGSWHAVTPP